MVGFHPGRRFHFIKIPLFAMPNQNVGHYQQIAAAEGSFIDDIDAAVDETRGLFGHRSEAIVVELDLGAAREKRFCQRADFVSAGKHRQTVGVGFGHEIAPVTIQPQRLVALQASNVLGLGEVHALGLVCASGPSNPGCSTTGRQRRVQKSLKQSLDGFN